MVVSTLLLFLAALPAPLSFGFHPEAQDAPHAQYASGRVIVRLAPGTDPADVFVGEFEEASTLAPALDLHVVRFQGPVTVDGAIDALGRRADVMYVVPDHFVELRDTIPDDPLFVEQWCKQNTGQTGGLIGADVAAPGAWDFATGSSQFAVAIVDIGIEHQHEDLIPNRWENAAEVSGSFGVDDDGNGYIDDLYGWNVFGTAPNHTPNGTIPSSAHGTHVTGIAVARGDNGIGVAGVSWESSFVSIAAASQTTSDVIAGYQYALDLKNDWLTPGGPEGANIVAANSSFGIAGADCADQAYVLWNDMFDLMGASGILSVGATVNLPVNVGVAGDVPSTCGSDFLIVVTSTGHFDDLAPTAGFGPEDVDLGAPGEDVFSTVTLGGYGTRAGTSAAAPQVTGAVALMHSIAGPSFAALRSADPAAAALAIKTALLTTTDVRPSLAGQTVSQGRLNLERAAEAIAAFELPSHTYCGPAIPNSTGNSATLIATGSTSVAVNDLTIDAASLPPGQTTLFLVSAAQGFARKFGGSRGNICLGGSIGRMLGQIQSADSLGRASASIDVSGIAQPQGLVPILPGATWNFQAWHRDVVGGAAVSNFTDAVRVTFSL